MLPANSLGETRNSQREIKQSTQLGTHCTAFFKGIRNWIYSQDMAKLVPVVDIFLVGPI